MIEVHRDTSPRIGRSRFKLRINLLAEYQEDVDALLAALEQLEALAQENVGVGYRGEDCETLIDEELPTYTGKTRVSLLLPRALKYVASGKGPCAAVRP